MRRTPAGMEIDEMKRIVVDSSASLYQLDGIDFAAVPLKIVTDEREYLDDGTLDAVEMATTLRTYKGKTSTSCPNIGDWLEAYEGADEIYAITITGTLSGSCNAAQLAAEEYQAEHRCSGLCAGQPVCRPGTGAAGRAYPCAHRRGQGV